VGFCKRCKLLKIIANYRIALAILDHNVLASLDNPNFHRVVRLPCIQLTNVTVSGVGWVGLGRSKGAFRAVKERLGEEKKGCTVEKR
jgi:hypothetical protein